MTLFEPRPTPPRPGSAAPAMLDAAGRARHPRAAEAEIEIAAIAAALAALAPPGVRTGCRLIAPDDEAGLLAGELDGFSGCAPAVRRRSGAARIVARSLMAELGFGFEALPRLPEGAAAWPPGLRGSLAHDEAVAVAAVASARDHAGLGIDIEPAEPLPPELIERVAMPVERRRYSRDLVASRLLFCVKEAVYKAQYPCDRTFLEFHDIEVDLRRNRAVTRTGRVVRVAAALSPRPMALAFIPLP